MIKVENINVYGFESAVRGMRNPMNSWSKSDSHRCEWQLSEKCNDCGKLNADNTGACESDREFYCIGENDLDLMKRLWKAGTEHRKYLRMIHASMDITAPLYWWKEFDTYKVGTVANSCSTMHKLTAKPFETSDFSCEKLGLEATAVLQTIINSLNRCRQDYLNSKQKFFWWQIIQLLPESYNQRRTIDLNYETVFTIIRQRSNHKLDEWRELVEILKSLPYVSQIGGFDEQSTATSGKEE